MRNPKGNSLVQHYNNKYLYDSTVPNVCTYLRKGNTQHKPTLLLNS